MEKAPPSRVKIACADALDENIEKTMQFKNAKKRLLRVLCVVFMGR
jgi:hypothetical protein